ncbi:hypothetical protein [Streptomyces sp. NRRL F-4489]|uniref:hypothetical protein n=1 Tax=Streptomyces sp. NRRL F-4489 TaxID=1609095 RepID=UPI000A5D1943|nr:hypothetical protein [Streptomyces sp. NRRL F-4489]
MTEWIEKDLTQSEGWDGNREWHATIGDTSYIVVGVLSPRLPYFEPDGALKSPTWTYTAWVKVPENLPATELVCLELSSLEEAQKRCERHEEAHRK